MLLTGGKPTVLGEKPVCSTFSTTDLAWTDLRTNPGLCSFRLVTNLLIHGIVHKPSVCATQRTWVCNYWKGQSVSTVCWRSWCWLWKLKKHKYTEWGRHIAGGTCYYKCIVKGEINISDGLHYVHFSIRAIYLTHFGFLDVIFVEL